MGRSSPPPLSELRRGSLRQPQTAGEGWYREGESHPPEEVYEAALCTLVEFPAIEIGLPSRSSKRHQCGAPSLRFGAAALLFERRLVESVGNAPTSDCLQGKCIACLPRPLNC